MSKKCMLRESWNLSYSQYTSTNKTQQKYWPCQQEHCSNAYADDFRCSTKCFRISKQIRHWENILEQKPDQRELKNNLRFRTLWEKSSKHQLTIRVSRLQRWWTLDCLTLQGSTQPSPIAHSVNEHSTNPESFKCHVLYKSDWKIQMSSCAHMSECNQKPNCPQSSAIRERKGTLRITVDGSLACQSRGEGYNETRRTDLLPECPLPYKIPTLESNQGSSKLVVFTYGLKAYPITSIPQLILIASQLSKHTRAAELAWHTHLLQGICEDFIITQLDCSYLQIIHQLSEFV